MAQVPVRPVQGRCTFTSCSAALAHVRGVLTTACGSDPSVPSPAGPPLKPPARPPAHMPTLTCSMTLMFIRIQARVFGPVLTAVVVSTIFLGLVPSFTNSCWAAIDAQIGAHGAGPALASGVSTKQFCRRRLCGGAAPAVLVYQLPHASVQAPCRRIWRLRQLAGRLYGLNCIAPSLTGANAPSICPPFARTQATCRWIWRSRWQHSSRHCCTRPKRGRWTAPCCK